MINKFIFFILIIFGQFIKTNEKSLSESIANQKKELESRFHTLKSQLEETVFGNFLFKNASKVFLAAETASFKDARDKYAELDRLYSQANVLGFIDIANEIQRYLASSPKSAGLFDAFEKMMNSEKILLNSLIRNLKDLIKNTKFKNKLACNNLNIVEIEKLLNEWDESCDQNMDNLIRACLIMIETGFEVNDESNDQNDSKEPENSSAKISSSPNKSKSPFK